MCGYTLDNRKEKNSVRDLVERGRDVAVRDRRKMKEESFGGFRREEEKRCKSS